jgi:hypothetical protein
VAGVSAGKQARLPTPHLNDVQEAAPKAEEDEGPPQVEVLFDA